MCFVCSDVLQERTAHVFMATLKWWGIRKFVAYVETLKKFDYSYWKGKSGQNWFRVSGSWKFRVSQAISELSIYGH